jgi:hypothetical protein
MSTAAVAKKATANGHIAPCCGIVVSPPVNLLDQVSQSGHSGASAGIFRMTKQALLPGADYD